MPGAHAQPGTARKVLAQASPPARETTLQEPHLREASTLLDRSQADLDVGRYARAEAGLLALLRGLRAVAGRSGLLLEARALAALSRLAWERRRLDEAIRHARAAADAAAQARDPQLEFLARTREMRALYERGARARAWEVLMRLEGRDRSALAPRTAAEFYATRGLMHRRRGHADLARKNFQEAVRAGGDDPETILALADLASFENARREPAEAERHLDEAGRRSVRAPDHPFRLARLLALEADLRQDQGRRSEALRLLLAARSLHRAAANPLRAVAMQMELAWLLESGGQRDEALRERRAAHATALAERDAGTLRYVADSRVYALVRQSDLEENARLRQDLAQALPRLADPDDVVWTHIRLAELHTWGPRDTAHADEALATALTVAGRARRPDLEVWVEGAWGRLCLERPALDQASRHLERALHLASTLPPPAMDADDRYAYTSPGSLHRLLASVEFSRFRFEESAAQYRLALQADGDVDQVSDRCSDLQGLLTVAITTQDLDQAEKTLNALLDEIALVPNPMGRAAWTSIALAPLLGRAGTSRMQFFEDLSAPEATDTPSRLLLARVASVPARVERLLGACREWVQFEQQTGNPMVECTARLLHAFLLDAFGRTAEALDEISLGLEIARRGSFHGSLHLGSHLGTRILLRHGRFAEAEAMTRQAVEALQAPTMMREQCYYLNVLAALHLRRGAPREALAWATRAVDRGRQSGDSWMLACALAVQGRCQAATGDAPGAAGRYEEAARALHERKNSRDEGVVLVLLARTQRSLGQVESARATYQRALDLLREGEGNLELRECAVEMGQFLEGQGRANEALALYREAIREVVTWREQLPERRGQQRISDQRATRQLFERTIALLLRQGDNSEALRLLEMSHSLELLGSVDLEHLPAESPQARARLDRLIRLRREMTALEAQVREGERSGRAGLEQILATTREQFFAALNEIRRSEPDSDRFLSVRATDLAALQGQLSPQTLLVEYFPATDALYVLMVTRERFEIRRVGVTRERLGALVRRFRETVGTPHGVTESEGFRAANASLHDLLLAPLASSLRGRHVLAVVPGSVLWYLPMGALRSPQGRYLVEEIETIYLSSADVLNFVQERHPRPAAPHLLAVGEPAGTTLPGTRREIEILLRLFPGGRALLGAQATREALRREAPGATLLHIASHSTLEQDDPNRSAIQLADGPLRLAEIYGLHLPPSSLVVLSSCQSAMAEENPGRDLTSLATAFTTAGASTVVASLWRVDDQATADLMETFYRALQGGATRSAALRAAQVHALASPATRHPCFWAGFTLMGDPR